MNKTRHTIRVEALDAQEAKDLACERATFGNYHLAAKATTCVAKGPNVFMVGVIVKVSR